MELQQQVISRFNKTAEAFYQIYALPMDLALREYITGEKEKERECVCVCDAPDDSADAKSS
jgi:hypothetical protein